MSNTSATGGVLAPVNPGPAPLDGTSLQIFLQNFVVGVTGIDGTLVRPRWQAEPPVIPPQFTSWCATGVTSSRKETFPAIVHMPGSPYPAGSPSGLPVIDGYDQLLRHQILEMTASFYDTGVTGEADMYAGLLEDGVYLDQNREVLLLNGFGLIECDEAIVVPVLFKQRWMYRVDVSLSLRRQIVRNYPVENVKSAYGTISADQPPVTTQISVNA